MASKPIHTRGLTSFFTLFGFLVMSITGLVLYVVPAGRIAYWINWKLISLTKTDWGNIHILSSILFIVAGAFHIYLNWKALMNYFKSKVTKGIKLRRELSISSAVLLLVVVSSLYRLPPLSYLLDLNEFIKDAWIVRQEYEPPFGHAELLSLKVFTKKMEIDLNKATQELKAKGVIIQSPEEILEEIAENNGISPMNIYMIIRKFEPRPEPADIKSYTPEMIELEFAGTGFGNRTMAAVCESVGIDTSLALERLRAAGIDMTIDETVKKAAEAHGLNPTDLLKVILVNGYKP